MRSRRAAARSPSSKESSRRFKRRRRSCLAACRRTSRPQARPPELLVPLQTLKQVSSGHDADARLAGAIMFSGAIAPGQRIERDHKLLDRIAYIYPRAHPGTEAPLGWTLSQTSKTDLN